MRTEMVLWILMNYGFVGKSINRNHHFLQPEWFDSIVRIALAGARILYFVVVGQFRLQITKKIHELKPRSANR